jgi:hypothetical protein
VAFQANTSDLWTVGTAGDKDWQMGMMSGTSPAITAVTSGGYEATFQDGSADLWTVGTAGVTNWQTVVLSSTSPSITSVSGGSYLTAIIHAGPRGSRQAARISARGACGREVEVFPWRWDGAGTAMSSA